MRLNSNKLMKKVRLIYVQILNQAIEELRREVKPGEKAATDRQVYCTTLLANPQKLEQALLMASKNNLDITEYLIDEQANTPYVVMNIIYPLTKNSLNLKK